MLNGILFTTIKEAATRVLILTEDADKANCWLRACATPLMIGANATIGSPDSLPYNPA